MTPAPAASSVLLLGGTNSTALPALVVCDCVWLPVDVWLDEGLDDEVTDVEPVVVMDGLACCDSVELPLGVKVALCEELALCDGVIDKEGDWEGDEDDDFENDGV